MVSTVHTATVASKVGRNEGEVCKELGSIRCNAIDNLLSLIVKYMYSTVKS